MTDSIQLSSFGIMLNESETRLTDRFLYTGREYLNTIEEYHYRARHYNPDIGRFVSQDPIGLFAGDINPYRYADNSPSNYTDPLGLVSMAQFSLLVTNLSRLGAQCAKSLIAGAVVGEFVTLTIYIFLTTEGQPYIGRTTRNVGSRIDEHIEEGKRIVRESVKELLTFRGKLDKAQLAQVEQAFLEEAKVLLGNPTNLYDRPKGLGILRNRIRAAAKFANPC